MNQEGATSSNSNLHANAPTSGKDPSLLLFHKELTVETDYLFAGGTEEETRREDGEC